MRIIVALIFALALSSRANAFGIKQADCTSVPDYIAHNGANILLVAQSFFPQVGGQDAIFPSAQPVLDLSWTGITISALKGFFTIGGSPLATINIPLGFICLEMIP